MEFPGEAAGRNRPCRQVCEGDEDEGPRFGLRAEMVRRASEEGDRTCRGVARRCRMNENARTFVYTSLRPCAVLCLITQSRPTLTTPWTVAR